MMNSARQVVLSVALGGVLGCCDSAHEGASGPSGAQAPTIEEVSTITVFCGRGPGDTAMVLAPYSRSSQSAALAAPRLPGPRTENFTLAQLWVTNHSESEDRAPLSLPSWEPIVLLQGPNGREYSDVPWGPNAASDASVLVLSLIHI